MIYLYKIVLFVVTFVTFHDQIPKAATQEFDANSPHGPRYKVIDLFKDIEHRVYEDWKLLCYDVHNESDKYTQRGLEGYFLGSDNKRNQPLPLRQPVLTFARHDGGRFLYLHRCAFLPGHFLDPAPLPDHPDLYMLYKRRLEVFTERHDRSYYEPSFVYLFERFLDRLERYMRDGFHRKSLIIAEYDLYFNHYEIWVLKQ